MFRSLLFHLINVYALFTVETLDQCKKDCLVDPWSSWGSCSGPCGHQKQIRGRKLCCDEALKPWNWEHCLQHCNLPNTCNSNSVVFVKTEESCSQYLILVFAVHGTKEIVVKVRMRISNRQTSS